MQDESSNSLNRRRFVGFSVIAGALAAGSSASLGAKAFAMLAPDVAEATVFDVLNRFLAVTAADREVVRAFTRSLATSPSLHAQPPAAASRLIAGESGVQAMEQFILGEFIAHTNFLAVYKGKDTSLRLL